MEGDNLAGAAVVIGAVAALLYIWAEFICLPEEDDNDV